MHFVKGHFYFLASLQYFSPEVRFVWGISDTLIDSIGRVVEVLNLRFVSIYFIFS